MIMFGHVYEWVGIIPHCGVFPNLASVWWHSSKCIIYFILVLRMKVVFDGSAYQYSNKILYTLAVFVALFWVYAIFGDMTEIYGTYEYIPAEDKYWCQCHLAIYGIALSGGIDTVLSIVCLILFTRPLLIVLKNTRDIIQNDRNVEHLESDDKLQDFVVKYFLLTLIAITSTGIWTILALVSDFGALAAIDVNVNALCILLMGSLYKKCYFALCNLCHRGILKCKSKAGGTTRNNKSTATQSGVDL